MLKKGIKTYLANREKPEDSKPPVIKGIRQGGKTYIIPKFAKENFGIKTLFLLFLINIMLFSCESRDGDWDPMIWESNDISNINKNKNNIDVPQAGKSYVFTCKNYKSFWVYAIRENGKQLEDVQLFIDSPQYEDSYLSISIDKNKIHVTVFPNEGDQIRNISIGVTAGDIFDSFDFKQKGK